MKIKNILALLCFLCIGVSCSMEDDILNNVDMGGVGRPFLPSLFPAIAL